MRLHDFRKRFSILHLGVTIALLALTPPAASSQSEPVCAANRRPANGVEISYALTIEEPNRHLYRVELRVDGLSEDVVRISMPAWAPGAYTTADLARNVQAFSARSPQTGRLLEWEKVGKQTWQISRDPAADLTVTYEVCSQNLTD